MLLLIIFLVNMIKKLRIMIRYEKWKKMRKIKDKIKLRYKMIKILKNVKEKRDLNKEIEKLLKEKLSNFEKNDKIIIYYLQRE